MGLGTLSQIREQMSGQDKEIGSWTGSEVYGVEKMAVRNIKEEGKGSEGRKIEDREELQHLRCVRSEL